jgi:hypothetical protein
MTQPDHVYSTLMPGLRRAARRLVQRIATRGARDDLSGMLCFMDADKP